MDDTTLRDARRLFAGSSYGILSTISREIAGYPFGSVVTFATDGGGMPAVLISNIAEHTRNIKADRRVSLTLAEGGDDPQAGGRLTLVGDAVAVADDAEVAARYLRRFPQAADYHRAHDFAYYRIEVARVRYIGGFGRIHWIEPDALCRPNPFTLAQENGMIEHMNADHVDAMRDYCRLAGVDPGSVEPRLTTIDAEGFEMRLGKRLLRMEFDTPATTALDVRKALVELAHRARAAA